MEQLRLVMAELPIADVRAQMILSLFTDFESFTKFRPDPRYEKSLQAMLNRVIAWGNALKDLQSKCGIRTNLLDKLRLR